VEYYKINGTRIRGGARVRHRVRRGDPYVWTRGRNARRGGRAFGAAELIYQPRRTGNFSERRENRSHVKFRRNRRQKVNIPSTDALRMQRELERVARALSAPASAARHDGDPLVERARGRLALLLAARRVFTSRPWARDADARLQVYSTNVDSRILTFPVGPRRRCSRRFVALAEQCIGCMSMAAAESGRPRRIIPPRAVDVFWNEAARASAIGNPLQ